MKLPENLSPMGDRVLVEINSDTGTVTKAGIIVMDQKKADVTAKILAVGAGARTKDGILIPMSLKVNNIIVFAKEAMQEVTINSVKYGIVKESDVYGVLE